MKIMDEKTIQCPHCGRNIAASAKSCNFCGTAVDSFVSKGEASSPVEVTESEVIIEEGTSEETEVSPSQNRSGSPAVPPPIPSENSNTAVPPIPSESGKEPLQAHTAQEGVTLPPPIPAASGIAEEDTVIYDSTEEEEKPIANEATESAEILSVSEASGSTPPPPAPPTSPTEEATAPVYPRKPTKKNNNTLKILLIVGLIVGAMLLIGGGIAAYFIFKGAEKYESIRKEHTEYISDIEDEIADEEVETVEMEEVVSENHYEMSTLLSGEKTTIVFDIYPNGSVRGKYAFDSTLAEYGDVPDVWFSFTGRVESENGSDRKMVLDVVSPDEFTSERWVVTLSGKGKYASLTGKATDYLSNRVFYVGSSKKSESLYEDYDYTDY